MLFRIGDMFESGSVFWFGAGRGEVGTGSSLLNGLFSRDDILSKEHIDSSKKDTESCLCSFSESGDFG